MTKEDIIRMAREAGWQYADGENGYNPLWKFGELVAAAEREACAKWFDSEEDRPFYGRHVAAAIRKRGQE